ncbi:MAG: autotransporter-associated beta strand repeat-containing protein [Puniceicoccales bacterium]|nr:autotransporter-associated beta strand repeat-containing protein [Puniceicoccales bacterium]
MTSTLDGAARLAKNGTGTLVMLASSSYTGTTTLSEGTLDFNGFDQSVGTVSSAVGSTLVLNGGKLTTAATGAWVLNGFTDLTKANSAIQTGGAMTLGSSGATAFLKVGASSTVSGTVLNLGTAAAGNKGAIEINGNNARGTFTGAVTLGATGAAGELRVLNGGTFSANNMYVGSSGAAYLEVSGGSTLTVAQELNVAHIAGGSGEILLRGEGSRIEMNGMFLGRTGHAVMTVDQNAVLKSTAHIVMSPFAEASGELIVDTGGIVSASYLNVGSVGTGTLTVKGTSEARGTLELGNLSVTANSTIYFDGGLIRSNSGSNLFQASVGSQAIQILDGGIFIDSNGYVSLSQATIKFTGSGALTKIGDGSLDLRSTGSYLGGTQVDQGTLVLGTATGNSQNVIGTGALNIKQGATASVTASTYSGAYEFKNALSGSGTLDVNFTAATNNFIMSGSDSAFTGTVNFRKSTFTLGNGVFSNASIISSVGNTLTVAPGKNTVTAYTFNGGITRFDLSANATDPGNAAGWIDTGVLTLTSGKVQIDPAQVSAVTTSRPLLQQDDGGALVRLVSAPSVVGSVSNIGVINLAGETFKGKTQNVVQDNSLITGNVEDTGVVAIGYYGATLTTGDANDGLYLNTGALSELELQSGKTTVLSGDSGSGGAGDEFHARLTGEGRLWVSATDTITLNQSSLGNNTYQGGTTIGSGTLAITSNTALGSGTLTYTNGTTLRTAATVTTLANNITTGTGAINATLETQGNLAHSGTISGDGNLTKRGTGILTLTGSGTYTGNFTATQGGLNIIGHYGDSASTTTVRGTNTSLHGIGTIGGKLVVGAGATFTPGKDARNLTKATTVFTVSGDVTLEVGASIVFDLAAPGNTAALAMNGGTFTAGNAHLTINVADSYVPQGLDRFNLISGVGAISTAGFDNVGWDETIAINGADFRLTYDGASNMVSLVAIPEPSTYALLGGVAAFALVAIRRRKKQ